MVKMVRLEDGKYVPEECCTYTNPNTSGGQSYIDDVDLPCDADCEGDCDTCIIQKVFNEYAVLQKESDALKNRCMALTSGSFCEMCPIECKERNASQRKKEGRNERTDN